jgi:hypothetical protein
MGLKKCEKCGEMVDKAKAFCPGCGNPFIDEETRRSASEFDKYAGTLQVTASAYNMMLSEMGLDTSRPPDAADQPIPNQDLPDNGPTEVTSPNRRRFVVAVMVGAVVLIPLAAALVYFLFK